MLLQELKPGVKVEIRFVQEVSRSTSGSNETATVYASKIYDLKDDDTIIMDMPTKAGKLLLLPVNVRYDFTFTTTAGLFRAEGTISERFKEGNFYLLKARLTTKLEKKQRREYYRLNVMMPLVFERLGDDYDTLKDLYDFRDFIFNMPEEERQVVDSTMVDISGGGIRAVSPIRMKASGYALLHFKLVFENKSEENMDILAKVIAMQPIPDNDKFSYRFKFIFHDSKVQERIIRYIFEEERRLRKKGQG